jgi:hypothetical protein
MKKSRTVELVLFELLAVVVAWTYYDWFVEARAAEYYAEKPIRLMYVVGFAVWGAICLAFVLGRAKHRNRGWPLT